MPAEKVVLAYSGGLDTSVAIRWLKDQGWDVVAFTVDLGEKKDLDAIQKRALKTGASAAYVADGRLPFLQLFVWPSLQAGAVYEKEYPLATALARPLIARLLVEAAHDISDGGLAIALAESCLAGGHGCRVSLPGDPFVMLFSESAARVVVAVRPGSEAEFAGLCAVHGVPAQALGVVGGDDLEITGEFSVSLAELAAAHRQALPALFG